MLKYSYGTRGRTLARVDAFETGCSRGLHPRNVVATDTSSIIIIFIIILLETRSRAACMCRNVVYRCDRCKHRRTVSVCLMQKFLAEPVLLIITTLSRYLPAKTHPHSATPPLRILYPCSRVFPFLTITRIPGFISPLEERDSRPNFRRYLHLNVDE